MNEAQILLAIENLMKDVTKKTYDWERLELDVSELRKDAECIYDINRSYTPLVQAYFDLLPEWIGEKGHDKVFTCPEAFREFQTELLQKQDEFIDHFKDNNCDNKASLEHYFLGLVERHRKLLLVRVDLHYDAQQQPSITQFNKDIEKLLNRIQNKDTCFKGQVGYAYRLEQGGKTRGYHCHLLLIYNGSLHCQDSYLGQQIGMLWKARITHGKGEFFNCNQAEHKQRFEKMGMLGIGMVERSKSKQVENACLAISYLASPEKDEQYLRGALSRMRQFGKGQLRRYKPLRSILIPKNHRYTSLT